MTLRNGNTIEYVCFVSHMAYEIDERQIYPRLSKATWPGVMAMNIAAMISYIYCGKSVFQALSPRGKVRVWGPDLGLDYALPHFWWACIIKSHYLIMHSMHYLTMKVNNARMIMHAMQIRQ